MANVQINEDISPYQASLLFENQIFEMCLQDEIKYVLWYTYLNRNIYPSGEKIPHKIIIVNYFKLSYGAKDRKSFTNMFYQVPIETLSKGTTFADAIRKSTVDVFFNNHRYDHQDYNFKIELLQEKTDDIHDPKLTGYLDSFSIQESRSSRYCNLALGAYFGYKKLMELGYTIESVPENNKTWVFKYTGVIPENIPDELYFPNFNREDKIPSETSELINIDGKNYRLSDIISAIKYTQDIPITNSLRNYLIDLLFELDKLPPGIEKIFDEEYLDEDKGSPEFKPSEVTRIPSTPLTIKSSSSPISSMIPPVDISTTLPQSTTSATTLPQSTTSPVIIPTTLSIKSTISPDFTSQTDNGEVDKQDPDKKFEILANKYTLQVAGGSLLVTEVKSQFLTIVSPQKLRELVANNVEKIVENTISYLRWKKTIYLKKLNNLNLRLNLDKKVIEQAELTSKEREEVPTDTGNKMALSYIKNALNMVDNKIKDLSSLSKDRSGETDTKKFAQILKNYNLGIDFILKITEENVQNQISTLLASLVNGYQGLSSDFQNINITGPAGVGKTTLAEIISQIFLYFNIIASNVVKKVSRSELVAGYVGQTSNKTKIQLYSALEGILFIDEAYQIAGCPSEDSYGMESLTELLTFLGDFIGISIVIVAGYEDKMEMCFYNRNEGLKRRFPNRYKLTSYSPTILFKILLLNIYKNYTKDIFENKENVLRYLYKVMVNMYNNNLFPNMVGSIQILSGKILKYYLSLNELQTSIISALYEYIIENSPDKNDNAPRLLAENILNSII